jgi:2-polyprenyl-6-methoxyphenol hydroxylase-like FAD-dependent oxidoreductase
MRAYEGKMGAGLVPLSEDLVYMYLTTPEPDNPRYPREGLAAAMRDKLKEAPPGIVDFADQITDDDEVVYRPLAWHFLEGDWYKGHVMLIGDAAHGTTPHLGQGAGMAIEDSLVLAEELDRADSVADAFAAFQERRYERCKYIVDSSVAICMGQIGKGPLVNYPKATADMIAATSEPL